MEPPLKRPRLFEPDESRHRSVDESDDYLELDDGEGSALEAEEDIQEGEYENVEEGDPDVQLKQTRARLDLKLKSKFEAIFGKYGRDFTGIGDEIDLKTGEIVVNNGHLLEMEDERDDGTAKPSLLQAFTQEPDETGGSTEAEDDEQDEIHESHVTLEDMEEDDMILFQTSAVSSGRPRTPTNRSALLDQGLLPQQREGDQRTATSKCSYPSENEILAQFGQDLGPKVARYVSQQRAQNSSSVEPAWRTPGLPLATPGKRPILKSILLQPDIDRSPSPKGSSSVWAPKMPRGRRRRDGADVAAIFKGEAIIRDRTWYSSGYVSTTVTKQCTERVGQSQSRRTLGVPLNETLSRGKSKVELGPWAQSNQSNSRDKYGTASISDCEPDSSEEKVAKFYKPRRSWPNPGFPTEQGKSSNFDPQDSTSRDKGKGSSSSKVDRAYKIPFTEADDEALLEWVEEALKRGFALWSSDHWKTLAEKNPRHTHLSWKARYRRRFWQKGIILSIAKEEFEGTLGKGSGVSEAIHQTCIEPRSRSDHSYSSDRRSYEILQDALPSKSRTCRRNVLSQEDQSKKFRAETTEICEILDSALCPPLVNDFQTTEEHSSTWLQRSKLSQSPPAVFERGDSVHANTSENIPAIRSPQSNSGLQNVGFTSESLSISTRETRGKRHAAIDINHADHKSDVEGAEIASRVGRSQIILSTDVEMIKPPGVQTLQQIPRKSFDTSYDFSDDEDEIEPVQQRGSFCLQVPDVATNKASAERETIDLTIEDSAISKEIATGRQAPRGTPRRGDQSLISISSSSSINDVSEFEEVKFFLQSGTPTPPVSDAHMTLSEILGPEDFEELRKGSPVPLIQPPQITTKAPDLDEGREDPLGEVRSTPARNATPKGRTPISTTRASILRGSMEVSPSSPMVETPGGTMRRCGENGFRCKKGFCFKCLDE